jgi:hypothetical protein
MTPISINVIHVDDDIDDKVSPFRMTQNHRIKTQKARVTTIDGHGIEDGHKIESYMYICSMDAIALA